VRVLLTGATGFIGSAVRARLVAEGHDVIGVTRRAALAISQPGTQWIVLDIAQRATAESWEACLVGVDAAVNCAGVLQDGLGDSTSDVHVTGATAFFSALEHAGIRRVVHISALGVDRAAVTAFSASKLAGDCALKAGSLEWVILRPSVVVAPGAAYGGSALLRGLAALPFLPDVVQAGRLQLVQLQDLVETVAFFLQPNAPVCLTLEVCGPDPLTLTEVLRAFRRWLGLKETYVVPIPTWLLRAMSFSGDFLSLLGWRSPVRTTTLRELAQGSTGNPEPWITITGIKPKALARALAESPASVQERWFAQLYFVKAVVFAVLSLFWLLAGLITLGPAWHAGQLLLRETGLPEAGAPLLAVAGALADILVGFGIAFRATPKCALRASLVLSVMYLVAGTALTPALWADPLGPLLKIAPIMALSLAALAIADDR
jgi:uncharacterized protein YbjT (DUF2867 family)